MKKTSIQFHATYDDLYEFALKMINNKYVVIGLAITPKFEVQTLKPSLKAVDFNELDMVIISKTTIQIKDEYKEFINNQTNILGITVGKNYDNKIIESIMWSTNNEEIDSEWKKIINNFKKHCNKGAWVVNSYNNAKIFDKSHLYTDLAKEAYNHGIKLCAFAGWNVYELDE